MAKLIPLRTYVTPEQQAALQKVSDETGAPVASLVRRALDMYFGLGRFAKRKGARS